MISGACCIPSMANVDNIVRKLIEDAIVATGLEAKVTTITASAAYGNRIFRDIVNKGISMSDTPVIIINGELIACGIPDMEVLKKALLRNSDIDH